MLSNHRELKEELIQLGVKLTSQTDTELMAQFIGLYIEQGMTTKDAIKKVVEDKVEGTYAVAIISKQEPNKIYLSKNTGTLIVGVHDDFLIACSEPEVFQNYTDKYIVIGGNELVEVSLDNFNQNFAKYELKIAEK